MAGNTSADNRRKTDAELRSKRSNPHGAAPYALLSGGGCQVGNIFGVTVNSQNIGDSSELVVEGVFDLAKDASTFNPGTKSSGTTPPCRPRPAR